MNAFYEHHQHSIAFHYRCLDRILYCDNLVFKRRAPLEALCDRRLDVNRHIGQPRKVAVIFGRRVTRRHGGSSKR